MEQLVEEFGHATFTPFPVVVARLLLAALFGAAIGFEREWRNRPAGLRTHILVCVAAATFAIEARDSLTGQLLGRAVDRREAGEGPTYRRNYTSNLADFEALFDTWARIAARGLTELKSASPVNTDGIRKQ